MRLTNRSLLVPPPGASPSIDLPPSARALVRASLRRLRAGDAVLVFDGDARELRIADRDALVQQYRRVGVRELVVQLRSAVVRPGHVLGLVDLAADARVIELPIADLLGVELPTREPSAAEVPR